MDAGSPRAVPSVSSPTPTEAVADLLAAHVDELADVAFRAARALDSQIAQTEESRGHEAAAANLLLLARALREGRGPTPAEVEAVAGVAVERARQGVSSTAFARGYSTVLRHVWERLLGLARDAGVDEASLHEPLQVLWAWADAMAEHASAEFARYELEQARHDEQARTQFLSHLLEGSLSAAEIRARAASFGLQPGRQHVAVHAALAPGTDLPAFERALRSALGGRRALVGLQGDEVVGVLPAEPRLEPGVGVVAVGPPAELADLRRSHEVASRLLAAAVRLGCTGSVRVEDVMLRMVVAGEDDIGQLLEERLLAPLASAREDLAGTVDSYLRNGMRIESVAQELFLHPNSVRKRLKRFEELTGADLTDTGSVVQVWWAMRRRELVAPPAAEA
jgi:hypothetical protein